MRVVFVGSNRSIESSIVAEQGIEHRILPVEPLTVLKKNPFRFVYQNWQALRSAGRLLRELKPGVVVGLGGYASAPLVWAASRKGIPVVLLEQNVVPGKTNRWLSRYATAACVSFAGTGKHLARHCRVSVTGNPVRKEISSLLQQRSAYSEHSADESRSKQLLILGGSQGADSLNAAVVEAVRRLRVDLAGWQLVHQTGPRDVVSVRAAYEEAGIPASVEPFFKNMGALYERTDLVISRAGATTLAELACAGIPAILVPFPFAADDHQTSNAQAIVEQHAAVMVKHGANVGVTAEALVNSLCPLLNDRRLRLQMGQSAQALAQPDAALKIADVIDEATKNRNSRRQ